MNWLFACGLTLASTCIILEMYAWKWKFKLKSVPLSKFECIVSFIVRRSNWLFLLLFSSSSLPIFARCCDNRTLENLHFCIVYWADACQHHFVYLSEVYLNSISLFEQMCARNVWPNEMCIYSMLDNGTTFSHSFRQRPKFYVTMWKFRPFSSMMRNVWVRKPIQIVDIKWLMCRKVLSYRTHWEGIKWDVIYK